jgi:phosphoribosylformylglycinamidine synthase
MKAVINIQLKQGVLDPQGKAVLHALGSLGFDDVNDARIGKQIILDLNGDDKDGEMENVTKMCEELLANTVIEDYDIEIM